MLAAPLLFLTVVQVRDLQGRMQAVSVLQDGLAYSRAIRLVMDPLIARRAHGAPPSAAPPGSRSYSGAAEHQIDAALGQLLAIDRRLGSRLHAGTMAAELNSEWSRIKADGPASRSADDRSAADRLLRQALELHSHVVRSAGFDRDGDPNCADLFGVLGSNMLPLAERLGRLQELVVGLDSAHELSTLDRWRIIQATQLVTGQLDAVGLDISEGRADSNLVSGAYRNYAATVRPYLASLSARAAGTDTAKATAALASSAAAAVSGSFALYDKITVALTGILAERHQRLIERRAATAVSVLALMLLTTALGWRVRRQITSQLSTARALIESTPVAIYHTDASGQITYVNAEYRKIFGLTSTGPIDDWAQAVHPEDRPRMEASWADFCANPRPITFDWRILARDAVCRVMTEQVVAAETLSGFVGTITDITERVSARNELRRAEQFFQSTFDQAPIGVVYLGREGEIQRCNPAFAHMLGYSPAELEATALAQIVDATDLPNETSAFRRLWNGEKNYYASEKRYLRKDRTCVWTNVSAALVRDDKGLPLCSVSFVQDITAKRKLRQLLEQSESLLASVISEVPIAILACDANGQLTFHNGVADELFAIVSPDASASIPPTPSYFGAELRLPDGVTAVEPGEHPFARALRGEPVSDTEFALVHPDGSLRRTRQSARKLVANDGEILGAVAVAQDVTHLKQLERELTQAQKLESIGQLAAGIAHEINTPTQFIGDNIRFLQGSFREILDHIDKPAAPLPSPAIDGSRLQAELDYLREEIPKAIGQSLEGVDRIAKIVGAMKDFSHPGIDKTPLDLNRAIASTIVVAGNEWKYVANLSTDFDPGLPLVPVMPGPFNQVILNILVNAAHAIGDAGGSTESGKGTITVATRRVDDWAEIRIRDTGCGMPAHVAAKIFDPFFTTKAVGKGTGQGLTIAYDVVVNKHGGSLTVDSEPGLGTTFILRLPLRAVAAAGLEAA